MQIRAKNFIKISFLVLEKTCVICYNISNIINVKKECGKGLDNDDEECDNPVSKSVEHNFAWRFCQYPFCKNCNFFQVRCARLMRDHRAFFRQ